MGSADFDFDDGERNIISRDWGGQEKGNNLISRFELMPPTYERNLDAAGGEPSCAICGKGVTNRRSSPTQTCSPALDSVPGEQI